MIRQWDRDQNTQKGYIDEMKKKKGIKSILLVIVIVVLILLVRACKGGQDTVLNIVETVTPHMGQIEEIVSLNGITQSKEEKYYFCDLNGKLDKVQVEVGDVVRAGDVLITYDMDVMEKSLEQARLQYVSSDSSYQESLASNQDALKERKEAETNIKVLKQQIADEEKFIKNLRDSLETIQSTNANALAEQNMNLQKRMIELQKDPIANEEELTNIQLEMQTNSYLSQISGTSDELKKLQNKIAEEEERLAGYEQYKAEMESQKQQADATILSDYQKENLTATGQLNLMAYEEAQKDYELAKQGVVADFDGIVMEVSAIEGMPVGEGTQMLALANDKDVKVQLTVGKYDLKRIAVGQPAEITINDKQYKGSVTKVNRVAVQDATGSSQVQVEVSIDQPDENIYLGIEAKVEIQTSAEENTMLIPVEVVNADKQGDFVYVVENGIAVRKNIVCGISTVEHIEVKEGLTTEDKVILSSLVDIEEGMSVVDM